MRLDDLLIISFRQLFRQSRLYWGVAVTIALGTAGFVTLFAIGNDYKNNLGRDLDLIGGVTILRVHFDNRLTSRPQEFKDSTVSALRQMPGVRQASLVALTWSQVSLRASSYGVQIIAVDDEFWRVRGFSPLKGKLFGPEELQSRARVCLLGSRMAEKIFGAKQAMGETLKIGQELYRVIGILGGLRSVELADSIYLPLTTAKDRIPGLFSDRLYVRCLTWDDVNPVVKATPALVKAHQSTDQLYVDAPWKALEHVKRVAWWTQLFVYLAVISTLLLGSVGIWAVMKAAVRTRTREIGLKKAMGSLDCEIMAEFLTQALSLSLCSALIGVGLGWLVVDILSGEIGMRPSTRLLFISSGLGIAMALFMGVTAGLYPSILASRMDVVKATRHE